MKKDAQKKAIKNEIKERNKNLKKLAITLIISLIISVLLNVIFVMSKFYTNQNIFERVLNCFLITSFICLHFSFGFKKLYNFLIEHRYLIAIIILIYCTIFSYTGFSNKIVEEKTFSKNEANSFLLEDKIHNFDKIFLKQNEKIDDIKNVNIASKPIKDITLITKIFNIGYLFLPTNIAFAFWWNFRILALILATFELCMIITDRDRFFSIFGTILIAFSTIFKIRFMQEVVETVIFGEIMLVLIDKFMKTKKEEKWIKLAISFGFGISLISYLFTFDLSSIIGFGYLFIALLVWIILKNRKEYKFEIKDLIYLLIPIFLVIICFYRYNIISNGYNLFNSNTFRDRNGLNLLFSYTYNIIIPFKEMKNIAYFSSIISVFPIPILIAFYYLYKKENHAEFLFPMLIVGTIQIIQCLSGLPDIISNIFLLKYISVETSVIAVTMINVFLIIYIISNIDEKLFNIKSCMRITIISMCLLVFLKVPSEISSKMFLYIYAGIYCLLTFLLLNFSEKKYRNVFIVSCIMITLISGISINSLSKGENNAYISEKIENKL